MSGFNFGGAGAPTGGFTFGTSKTATTTPATGFSFSTTGTGGFNFGTPSQPAASTPSTSLFSLSSQTPAAQTSGFSFGASTPASGGSGFSLGVSIPKLNLSHATATPTTTATGGFGLSGSTLTNAISSTTTSSQGPAPTGFVFSSASTTSAAPSSTPGGFSFTGGGSSQTASSGFTLGSLGSTTQPTTLATLPFTSATPAAATAAGTTQPAVPTLAAASTSAGTTLFASIATTPASASSSSSALSLGTSTSAGAPGTATQGFNLKTPGVSSASTATSTATSATTTTGSTFTLKSGAPTGLSGNLQPNLQTSSTTTGVSASPVMTYAQLESLINKWSLELEDQERHFLQQATQVNAWDRTLIENGEKITTLHREVEKVKLDQKRLDQELDFILSQQKELEDLLSPLEESVKEQSGTVYLQHADEEREKTYKLAENIDAQLKRMAQDLKDIIEHLNTSGGPADTSDPLQQICKILNAHMDSLQWIDQNSALLQRKVEEVTKVCEGRRKEQERSFRITFD
ncbi:nuclear pore glycoprotein p62 [Sorex araneus]|uniref:nuclear pore glycoprotein p62 n=1 Tax=Sorex araneus TaxID=42254 RepID=UPI0003318539|nr:nuclear pore glycoprotein p62 [Sorex araneus]XP_055001761.1 nuclear pore glycoprotein p62 [Sorex araneus]XP_055001762.1 nuclear pore glycoprotein p62 [Sorex araneus]